LQAEPLGEQEKAVFQTATGPNALTPMAHLQMVAVVQPFLSGGVSKTVTVSSDATPGAAEQVFIDAWRLGLKSITVYREGSKLAQPLTTDED